MKAVRSKKRDEITEELVTDPDGKAGKEDVCISFSRSRIVSDTVSE